MPLSAAFIHHAPYHVLLLLAATTAAAVSTVRGDGNTVTGNATATTTTGGEDTKMYICYLCTGRNPMMIRRCPIYWDYCHLVCYDDVPSTTAAANVIAVPVVSSAAPARRVGSVPRKTLEDEECYVMKLYENGSYTIVSTLGCSETARCLLSCGGGDLAADEEEAVATHPGDVSPAVTATAPHDMPPPRVTDYQRCGSQVMTATSATRVITGGV